jgi:hypothetical protein
MPATATGRGAQVLVDPMSDTAKAIRGAYAATFEANTAKVAADIAAGLHAASGSKPDGTTSTNIASDIAVSPSVAPRQAGSLVVGSNAGPTIVAGTGVASGTQPSGSIFIRTDGAAGARLYVSQGGGTWIAIAAV